MTDNTNRNLTFFSQLPMRKKIGKGIIGLHNCPEHNEEPCIDERHNVHTCIVKGITCNKIWREE